MRVAEVKTLRAATTPTAKKCARERCMRGPTGRPGCQLRDDQPVAELERAFGALRGPQRVPRERALLERS